jgi:hypothetical protein
MPDREPQAWETDAAAPFITMERVRGVVGIWALDRDRFKITAPQHKRVVVGFNVAQDSPQAQLSAVGPSWVGPPGANTLQTSAAQLDITRTWE